jgi:iron(III) transport system permease protein
VACSGLPLVQLAGQLVSGSGGLSILGTWRPWQLLGHSVMLAATVTAASLALGVPLGTLMARTDLPGRRWVWAIHAFPFALPPFLLALGWFHALGRQGFIGSETSADLLFGWPGTIWILTFAFTPVVSSLVGVALMAVDSSQEEAARVVAPPWRVVTRILVPAVKPAVVLGALLVFVLTISELGVPMFLRVDVFPAAVFARLGGVDYAPGEAFGLVLPLLPLILGLALIERRFVGSQAFAVLGLRGGSRLPLPLGKWRWILSLGAWVVAMAGLCPLVALAWRAFRGASVSTVFEWARAAPVNSLLVSAMAATIVTLTAAITGHALARGHPAGRALDAVSALAFITPAAVLGVGLIGLWNRPEIGPVYSSLAILVIGFVARYGAVGIRACAVAFGQVPTTLEESASAVGAGYGRRMWRILIPSARRGLGFAWLATFIFCLRDLETSVLYYPPGREPLTVRIFTLEANGPEAIVAGLACLQVVITAAVMVAVARLLGPGSRS